MPHAFSIKCKIEKTQTIKETKPDTILENVINNQ